MRKGILALLTVVVIGVLGVGYFLIQTSSFGVLPLSGNSTTYTSSNPNLGIRLVISLNLSAIHAGGEVNYTASVWNTRTSINNVSSASNWVLPDLIMTACGPTDSPIAFAVIRGHYDSRNISQAPPVNLGMGCTTVMGGVTTYSFQPSSDVASIYTSSVAHCNSNPCQTRAINTSRELSQYFSGVGSEAQGVAFTSGAYTVAAEDEWGDIAMASFTVS